MVTKIIDDKVALRIFNAIKEKAARSFSKYNCLRRLPTHKIKGEYLFYLDELTDFAEKELNWNPSEVLEQVVNQGLIACYSNLEPDLQQKAGFSLKAFSEKTCDADLLDDKDKKIHSTKETLKLLAEKNTKIAQLEQENARLKENVESFAVEKIALKREIAHLEEINEEFYEQAPANLVSGYNLNDGVFSGYTALTTHSLNSNVVNAKAQISASSSDSTQSSANSKNRKHRKRR